MKKIKVYAIPLSTFNDREKVELFQKWADDNDFFCIKDKHLDFLLLEEAANENGTKAVIEWINNNSVINYEMHEIWMLKKLADKKISGEVSRNLKSAIKELEHFYNENNTSTIASRKLKEIYWEGVKKNG